MVSEIADHKLDDGALAALCFHDSDSMIAGGQRQIAPPYILHQTVLDDRADTLYAGGKINAADNGKAVWPRRAGRL